MSDPLTPHLQSALECVLGLARAEGPLRDELRKLAKAYLDLSEGAATVAPETREVVPAPVPEVEVVVAPPVAPPPAPKIVVPTVPAEPLPSIYDLPFAFKPRFSEPKSPTPAVEVSTRVFNEPEDPQQIGARCQLKADSVRWRVRRSQALDATNGQVAEFDAERAGLIDRAKQLQCFLWMIQEDAGLVRDPVAAEELAGSFEATAHTARLAGQALHLRERLRDDFLLALDLFAEAQSALASPCASSTPTPTTTPSCPPSSGSSTPPRRTSSTSAVT